MAVGSYHPSYKTGSQSLKTFPSPVHHLIAWKSLKLAVQEGVMASLRLVNPQLLGVSVNRQI